MRNTIIDNLRGICMLGVIGIHIGSLALAPNNFTLYLLLEILSRYSVPSFFFISGYGLACTDKGLLSGSRLNYIDFMKKRLRGAALSQLVAFLHALLLANSATGLRQLESAACGLCIILRPGLLPFVFYGHPAVVLCKLSALAPASLYNYTSKHTVYASAFIHFPACFQLVDNASGLEYSGLERSG